MDRQYLLVEAGTSMVVRYSIAAVCWMLIMGGAIRLYVAISSPIWLPFTIRQSYWNSFPLEFSFSPEALDRYLSAVTCFWMAGLLHCLHLIAARRPQ
jgi:hypothetical protein